MALVISGCSSAPGEDTSGPEPYVGHDEPSDFAEVDLGGGKADGISPSSFDKNRIVAEDFFLAAQSLDAAGMQRFLEATPYDRSCFLADETFGGRPASQMIVDVAREKGINPVVLLARMQVEKGLIGREDAPSSSSLRYAFGCGCYDGSDCDPEFEGFENQLRCAASTLRNAHDASKDGSGNWRKGHTSRSSDGYSVTPADHSTAALYNYTPWVLPNRGGNWLVWNVTRRFARHFIDLGLLDPDNPTGPALRKWIGSSCAEDPDCDTGGRAPLVCHKVSPDQGVCTMPCEGTCPDASGFPTTFCATATSGDRGFCVSKAEGDTADCSALPGTVRATVARFIGASSSSPATAGVCMPSGL